MLDQLMSASRVDFAPSHRQPPASRLLLATIASIAGLLAADAALVVVSQALFPGTRGYSHFQFADYAKLTIIGVLIACAGFLTSDPRGAGR